MNEKMKILEMLAQGIITVAEANELLSTLENTDKTSKVNSEKLEVESVYVSKPSKKENRKIVISVESADGDDVKVNLPINAIKAIGVNGLKKMTNAKGNSALEGIDFEALFAALDEDNKLEGDLVNIESADGDSVKITIK